MSSNANSSGRTDLPHSRTSTSSSSKSSRLTSASQSQSRMCTVRSPTFSKLHRICSATSSSFCRSLLQLPKHKRRPGSKPRRLPLSPMLAVSRCTLAPSCQRRSVWARQVIAEACLLLGTSLPRRWSRTTSVKGMRGRALLAVLLMVRRDLQMERCHSLDPVARLVLIPEGCATFNVAITCERLGS